MEGLDTTHYMSKRKAELVQHILEMNRAKEYYKDLLDEKDKKLLFQEVDHHHEISKLKRENKNRVEELEKENQKLRHENSKLEDKVYVLENPDDPEMNNCW